MTVFDPMTMHALVDDAEGRAFLVELVTTYRRMLQLRVDRVVGFLEAGDVVRTMDAVLSLKVSSTMTGAVEVAGLAMGIEADLRSTDLATARGRAGQLPAAVRRTKEAIDAFLVDPAVTTGGPITPTTGVYPASDSTSYSTDSMR